MTFALNVGDASWSPFEGIPESLELEDGLVQRKDARRYREWIRHYGPPGKTGADLDLHCWGGVDLAGSTLARRHGRLHKNVGSTTRWSERAGGPLKTAITRWSERAGGPLK